MPRAVGRCPRGPGCSNATPTTLCPHTRIAMAASCQLLYCEGHRLVSASTLQRDNLLPPDTCTELAAAAPFNGSDLAAPFAPSGAALFPVLWATGSPRFLGHGQDPRCRTSLKAPPPPTWIPDSDCWILSPAHAPPPPRAPSLTLPTAMGGCCCGPTEPAPALRPQASKIIVETMGSLHTGV